MCLGNFFGPICDAIEFLWYPFSVVFKLASMWDWFLKAQIKSGAIKHELCLSDKSNAIIILFAEMFLRYDLAQEKWSEFQKDRKPTNHRLYQIFC